MVRNRKRTNSRRKIHSRNRYSKGRQESFIPWKPILIGMTSIAVLVGVGYIAFEDMKYAKADEYGCYTNQKKQAYTLAFIDSSEPGFDAVQSRDLINTFTDRFKRLKFNERFSIVTTQESRIGSIPAPIVSLCGPAKSKLDLEELGAATATLAFIQRQGQQIFRKLLKPHLENVFDSNPQIADRQRNESPILEQLQSLSRMPEFSEATGARTLIVVSDSLQNTIESQFCIKKGHMPRFSKFKTKAYYQRVKPSSLAGIDVSIYMLMRGNLGAYCTEDELRQFWIDYFKNAGAKSVKITRLRQGGYVSVVQ